MKPAIIVNIINTKIALIVSTKIAIIITSTMTIIITNDMSSNASAVFSSKDDVQVPAGKGLYKKDIYKCQVKIRLSV